jgi:hypothetical protein
MRDARAGGRGVRVPARRTRNVAAFAYAEPDRRRAVHADEGARAQHAHVAGDRQDALVSTFRDDGAAALEWVASYLERVREYPVLSRVEPGEIRAALPVSPPDAPEPFAYVLRDLDEVLMPGITHWQSPRYFAYFATTGAEPGILAELLIAGLNQVGILWRASPALQELERSADWLSAAARATGGARTSRHGCRG